MNSKPLLVAFWLCALASPPCASFIDPPVFSPQPIPENEAFKVSIRHGGCDGFPIAGEPIEVIRVAPNRVQLFVRGVHQTNAILCIGDIRNPTFDLPALPAGDYQFELYVRTRSNPAIPIHEGPVAPFTVVGSSITAIPTLSFSALLLMAIALVVGATWSRRYF